jgi:shikimate dehydrogenase
MDVVYNSLETKLIKEAKEVGVKTIDGVDMFVNQGVEAFEL